MSQDFKDHMSKINSGAGNPMFGKNHSEETKNTISRKNKGKPSTNKGKPMSEESKQKLRERNLGKKYPEEINKKKGRPGELNQFFGKHHTEETKEKLREAKCIPVICMETGIKYKSRQDAEEQTGIGASNTWRAIKYKRTAGGYHWDYIAQQND